MKYDMMVIGLGPAGMALSAMGSALGLKVLAIEKNKIGGECLNCGCIPSKALLKTANVRHLETETEKYDLGPVKAAGVKNPFKRVRDRIKYVNEAKTVKMFDKVDLVIGKGAAEFVDKKTVKVGKKTYTARKIYIATGTHPFVPLIDGINDVEYLTNENIFELNEVPKSMFIIGGGAIGCEMAQAFSRLGSKITVAHIDPRLLPRGDVEASELLQTKFEEEGISVYNGAKILSVSKDGKKILVKTDKGNFTTESLLIAAGRKANMNDLGLEKAGVMVGKNKILTNRYGRTNVKHIYAVGDINGKALLSHAAMHQGMLTLIDSMMPFKLKYDKFAVPWSVFTDPEVSQVGMTESEMKASGKKFVTIVERYEDYGRTIADEKPTGFVKVHASPMGKIYGATIIGESASELIHEFALAIHKKIHLHDIMLMQHSFPTISLLNKRIAEKWMMQKMKNKTVQKLARFMFRIF